MRNWHRTVILHTGEKKQIEKMAEKAIKSVVYLKQCLMEGQYLWYRSTRLLYTWNSLRQYYFLYTCCSGVILALCSLPFVSGYVVSFIRCLLLVKCYTTHCFAQNYVCCLLFAVKLYEKHIEKSLGCHYILMVKVGFMQPISVYLGLFSGWQS